MATYIHIYIYIYVHIWSVFFYRRKSCFKIHAAWACVGVPAWACVGCAPIVFFDESAWVPLRGCPCVGLRGLRPKHGSPPPPLDTDDRFACVGAAWVLRGCCVGVSVFCRHPPPPRPRPCPPPPPPPPHPPSHPRRRGPPGPTLWSHRSLNSPWLPASFHNVCLFLPFPVSSHGQRF